MDVAEVNLPQLSPASTETGRRSKSAVIGLAAIALGACLLLFIAALGLDLATVRPESAAANIRTLEVSTEGEHELFASLEAEPTVCRWSAPTFVIRLSAA